MPKHFFREPTVPRHSKQSRPLIGNVASQSSAPSQDTPSPQETQTPVQEEYMPLSRRFSKKNIAIADFIIIALVAAMALFAANRAINGPLTVDYSNYHESFAQIGDAYNKFEPKKSVQTLTENHSWQRGAMALKNPVRMDSNFLLRVSVNLGNKSSKQGGADGISFFFHPGSVWELGSNGNGMGIGGVKGAFGFKLDTYYNDKKDAEKGAKKGMGYSPDPVKFKDKSFGAFVNSQGVDTQGVEDPTVQNGYSQVILRNPQPQRIPQPSRNIYRDLILYYNATSKELLVTYTGKVWKRNIASWVGSNKTLFFTIAASTGGNYFNKQQIKIKSLTFTPGRR